jgi:ParB-like chromosome segregation protein Spo0J
VSDEKAEEIVIDSNIVQRQDLTPMEIARAYDKKKNILGNRQGQRSDIKGGDVSGATRDIIAKDYKVSGMTIDRYLRLINLVPSLQDAIDDGKLVAKTGMELGLIDKPLQYQIAKVTELDPKVLTTASVSKVRKLLKEKQSEAKSNNMPIDNVEVTDSELKSIFKGEITKPNGDVAKPIKLTIEVPADYDEDTREFIQNNAKDDPMFFLDLIKDYVLGNIQVVKNNDDEDLDEVQEG